MSYPNVLNEVASAVNAVIVVICGTVLKALPAIVVMVMTLSGISLLLESLLTSDAQPVSDFLAQPANGDMQVVTNDVSNAVNVASE